MVRPFCAPVGVTTPEPARGAASGRPPRSPGGYGERPSAPPPTVQNRQGPSAQGVRIHRRSPVPSTWSRQVLCSRRRYFGRDREPGVVHAVQLRDRRLATTADGDADVDEAFVLLRGHATGQRRGA
eukprot:CAMPEP_0113320606 /NCGR_PEP_ID=MMETSP0010_2-20120614/14366_1 /TAXON_ID=216773 ORGANISM="Corethron hystrix, Strain 308" /NCGR_SAMPLE_ID=MMETSP0010_2 /ASSEMBLY_ACC=CAM_ASM_000155 /LENGTH=125 /DNA_ID=CAMNT_0000178459 /DNA_START=725 /DNA_END=1102 /DNA_ORIENTATION=+ /assembly_acc=CAM_ASM_000155